jgi:hypothetical protein
MASARPVATALRPAPVAEPWAGLLEVARWAPSPHNIQTWKLRIRSHREAELLYDPRRLIPDEDTSGRFTWAGLGLFVECLDVAARSRGLRVEADLAFPELDPKAAGHPALGVLRLLADPRPPGLDPALVLARKTSRLAYDGATMPPALLARCQALAERAGHDLRTSTDPGFVDWVMRLNQETMFLDLAEPKARDEIALWLRTSRRQAEATRDGLWSRCLGVPGWLLRTFFRQRWVLELPVSKPLLVRYYMRSMRGTAEVSWLSGPWRTRADGFAAGRMLAQVWLALTEAGFAIHPFGSIITNPTANARLQRRMAGQKGDGTLWLLWRVGRSRPAPRSLRLEVPDLVVP